MRVFVCFISAEPMVAILKKENWFHADGFPIVVERRDPQEPFGLHAHEFSEIVIVTGGVGQHVTGSESYLLTTGDAFVIGGSRPHDYQNMEDLRLINILFDPLTLQLDLNDLGTLPGYLALFTLEPAWRKRHNFKSRLRLDAKSLATVVSYSDTLEEELAKREAGFQFLATAAFMQVVGYLSRCYTNSENPDSQSLLLIAEAITYLELNYSDEINLDDLAEIAHMSKRNFIRTFQTAMGRSPIAYLIQLRINRAIELLKQGELSITEIAMQVGFNDSNYFTRQFRQQIGTSPSLYRKMNKSSK
ncbi:HTH-type transcriptional activator RhaR [Gimesia aquarii]|uniref:HTH-type transcriptional activator RhaR n=2 Tax=Gimesia aquarii TaxID=2527964 RepID=A0A517VUE1_9PLAN|nr:HTH-type transcriptional activator RhaR [Gimesia aquarii]